jgi:branched-chain amino acid aminotransferase
VIVHLDGELIDASEARVSPFDAAYLYGDGLFDTLRSYSGVLYRLQDHLDRIVREAELLQLPFEPDLELWATRIGELLSANDLLDVDARVRTQISRGGNSEVDPALAHPESIQPVVFILAKAVEPAVSRMQEQGVRVMSLQNSFARGNFPLIKSLNYLPSVMAQRFALSSGFDEAILFNRQQKVLEGASSNVFMVSDGRLRTPSTRLGLLPGITRDTVLSLAAKMGLSVDEAGFELRDLLIADEVFLTGSVKEVVPVVGIDNSSVGEGVPGPITRQLQRAYRDDVQRVCDGAVD